jgi:hypothetical protein
MSARCGGGTHGHDPAGAARADPRALLGRTLAPEYHRRAARRASRHRPPRRGERALHPARRADSPEPARSLQGLPHRHARTVSAPAGHAAVGHGARAGLSRLGHPGPALRPHRAPRGAGRAYLSLEALPGEQAQVDWGNFRQIRVGSTTRLLSCFALVLSGPAAATRASPSTRPSRVFCAVTSRRSPRCRECPARLLYDNLKSVVLERVGDHIRFHHIGDGLSAGLLESDKTVPYRSRKKVGPSGDTQQRIRRDERGEGHYCAARSS